MKSPIKFFKLRHYSSVHFQLLDEKKHVSRFQLFNLWKSASVKMTKNPLASPEVDLFECFYFDAIDVRGCAAAPLLLRFGPNWHTLRMCGRCDFQKFLCLKRRPTREKADIRVQYFYFFITYGVYKERKDCFILYLRLINWMQKSIKYIVKYAMRPLIR